MIYCKAKKNGISVVGSYFLHLNSIYEIGKVEISQLN